jgi:hypothetical protein
VTKTYAAFRKSGKEKVSKFLSKFELCGQCGGAVRDRFRISGLHTLNFSLPKRHLSQQDTFPMDLPNSLNLSTNRSNSTFLIYHVPSPFKFSGSLRICTLHFPTASTFYTALSSFTPTTTKKFIVCPFPSRDVTNQTLPGRESVNYS